MQNKETKPTVSIVVPVRNGESTIESLLQSLAELDYDKEKVEVIVVDGNSTDKTRDIVKKYPFKMIIERKNGLNVARNTGIRNSTGDIVAFTDSDCVVPQDWVKKIAENFNDPKIGCVAGNVKGYHNNFLSEYADNSIVRVMPSFERREQSNVMKLFHHPAGCNIAFRREVVEKIGSFDEDIRYGFDDLELVERICKSGYEVVSDPDVIIQHKHRTSLRGLLKQHFKYGKGGGFLLKKKGTRDRFSTWALLNLLGFITWILMTGLFTFLTFATGWAIFALALFGVTLLPLLLVMMFYLYKARKDGRYGRAIVYPLIDLCRGFTFCVGQIYQLFKANEKH
jgi:glycosyltransferase involved in cell wall biosynthesis